MQKPKSRMENPCCGVPATSPSEDPAENYMNYETYDLMRVGVVPAPTSPDPVSCLYEAFLQLQIHKQN